MTPHGVVGRNLGVTRKHGYIVRSVRWFKPDVTRARHRSGTVQEAVPLEGPQLTSVYIRKGRVSIYNLVVTDHYAY